MLVLVQHLIRSGRHGRARTAELGRLAARWEAQPTPRRMGPEGRALAARIAALKVELSQRLAGVRSCTGCAEGCAMPSGHFPGGRCCGTATLEVFAPGEVAAMKAGGITAPLEPAEAGHESAGCTFRGPSGCVRPPEGRPSRCLVYVCNELRDELEGTGRAGDVHRLRERLDAAQAAFEARLRR
jgi:hypothetical protein